MSARKMTHTTKRFADALGGAGAAGRFAHSLSRGHHRPTPSWRRSDANGIELIVAGALERKSCSVLSLAMSRAVSCARRAARSCFSPNRSTNRNRSAASFSSCRIFRTTRKRRLPKSPAIGRTGTVRKSLRHPRLHDLRCGAGQARENRPEIEDQRDRTLEEEEAALEHSSIRRDRRDVPIEARCIRGNTGFAASDFVQSVEARSCWSCRLILRLPRGLPAHVAWLTDVIPCNLWVIR